MKLYFNSSHYNRVQKEPILKNTRYLAFMQIGLQWSRYLKKKRITLKNEAENM